MHSSLKSTLVDHVQEHPFALINGGTSDWSAKDERLYERL